MPLSTYNLPNEISVALSNEVELFSEEIFHLLEEPRARFLEAVTDILHRAGLTENFDCDVNFVVDIRSSSDQPLVEESLN